MMCSWMFYPMAPKTTIMPRSTTLSDRLSGKDSMNFHCHAQMGGKDAWLFLAAGFVVEALVWGQFEPLLDSL